MVSSHTIAQKSTTGQNTVQMPTSSSSYFPLSYLAVGYAVAYRKV